MESEVRAGMLEDFTTSLSTISHFKAKEPQRALESAEVMLEHSCEVYVLNDYSEGVRQRAMEFIAEAQALGYCQ